MSAHARHLAEWLVAQPDGAVATLFARREVSAAEPWNDFFDAAEALLEPASLARALEGLSRAEAQALQGGEPSPALRELALADAEGVPFPEVLAAAEGRTIPPAADAAALPHDEAASAHAAERAFTHLAAMVELLLSVRSTPVALLADGAPGAAERRRFESVLAAGIDLDELIDSALDSALVCTRERRLLITEPGEDWLPLPASARWSVLAAGFRARLPRSIRTPEGGWLPAAQWPGAEPWNPRWPERAATLRRRAIALGLLTETGAVPAWALPLSHGADADLDALDALLPQEVDRIFLQNDLTAIAPGPLAAGLDLRLRAAAERESSAQASSYRFSASSLAHAFTLGETEASLRAFLEGISLTGIPQPLGYLIERTAQQHGMVQVLPDAGRTRIRSSDPHLIEAMLIDQALRPLSLALDGAELTTRVTATAVCWALGEARYPAVPLAERGEKAPPHRPPAAPASAPLSADERYGTLIARLRAHHGPDSEKDWLGRALESAARARSVLLVEVAMPDGSARALTLEVTGFAGGRLRGTDRAADVERTLPLSHIRSVRPVG